MAAGTQLPAAVADPQTFARVPYDADCSAAIPSSDIPPLSMRFGNDTEPDIGSWLGTHRTRANCVRVECRARNRRGCAICPR